MPLGAATRRLAPRFIWLFPTSKYIRPIAEWAGVALPHSRSLLALSSTCTRVAVVPNAREEEEEEEDVARGGEMAAENKPEGLKKIRNPDRMYRSAVCYSGHAAPKGVSDDTEMNNEHGHMKIYLPKKLLECLPKCSSLPKERHRWNTNER
ncbi:calmodulin-binding transcription activator 1-like isoform X1 [Silurus asotus]|uniref:Calmodulin-binding transcription activator 1-like isoform X1 n=1 Tax=Silurus asotus TaxID=30991 RepID=A0AAD5A9S2_SILAS|nr:calmodulin-binding transcription activator 1-like isoform X1 [Silurus asotus]